MPSTGCCVPKCSIRGGYMFPKDKDIARKWTVAIRRDCWTPSKYSVVCCSHFRPDDYISETMLSTKPLVQRLKSASVPSIFAWSRSFKDSEAARLQRERALEQAVRKSISLDSPLTLNRMNESLQRAVTTINYKMKEKIPGVNSLSPFLEGLKFFIKTKAEYCRPKATFYEITVSTKLKIPTTLKAEILAGRNDWITDVEFLAIQFQENTGTTSVQEKTEVVSKNVTKYSSAESLKLRSNVNFTPCNRLTNCLSPPTQKFIPFPKKQVSSLTNSKYLQNKIEIQSRKYTGGYPSPVMIPVRHKIPTAKIISNPDNSEISKALIICQAVNSTRPTVVSHQLTSQNKSPAEKVKDIKPCLDVISKHIHSNTSEAQSQTEIVNYHLGKSLCKSPKEEFIDTKPGLDFISESCVKHASEGEPDLKPMVEAFEDSVDMENNDVCKLDYLGNSLVGYYGKDNRDHKSTFKTQNIKKEIELIEAGNTVTINTGISEDTSVHVKLADTSDQQTNEIILHENFPKKYSKNGFMKSEGVSMKKLSEDASIIKSLVSSANASITETKLSSSEINSTQSKQTEKPGLKNQSKRRKRKLIDEVREDSKCVQSNSIDTKFFVKRKC